MHINAHRDVINACRFCFMCRHLDTTANVTFREADIPRGRALILDRVRMNPELLGNADYVGSMYDCSLSGTCRKHCVSSYDETGLVLAARRDMVEAGVIPQDVESLAEAIAMQFSPELIQGLGNVVYIEATAYMSNQPEIATAFGGIMKRASVPYRVLRVNDTGKIPSVLGFHGPAVEMAGRLRDMIALSGCATVVTSCPATFDALKNDYPRWGVELDGIDVRHSSTYLLQLIETGALEPRAAEVNAYYIDSDFLRNYNDLSVPVRALLTACGYSLKPFGTNQEESYAMGEGAVVFDRLKPDLVRRMRKRFMDLMDSPDDLVITASPYTRHVLADSDEGKINVFSVEEAVMRCVG